MTKAKKNQYTYTTYNIDPKGSLPGGDSFNNFSELQNQIAKRKDAFAYGFTKNLIAYSLGRPYSFRTVSILRPPSKASLSKKSGYVRVYYGHCPF